MTEDIADLTEDEVRAYIAREYGDQLAAFRRLLEFGTDELQAWSVAP